MKPENHVRESIIDTLRKHPDGLPILAMARLVGSHRHTVTKYVYELIGAGVIHVRTIGTAKLCLLNESFVGEGSEKKILKRLKEGLEK